MRFLKLSLKLVSLFLIFFLHIFFDSLIAPLNSVAIINIFLTIIFLKINLACALFYSLILGLLLDWLDQTFLGFSTLIYSMSLFLIHFLRNTILSHYNLGSIFLLMLSFNLSCFLAKTLIKLNFNLNILQEIIFRSIFNTIICFIVFLLLDLIKKYLAQKFI